MQYLNHIKTPNSLIITLKNSNPIVLSSKDERFKEVIDLLDSGMYEDALDRASIGAAINKKNTGFKIVDGVAVIGGEKLPGTLSKRLVQFHNMNIDTAPLEAFWNNLSKNPSNDSKQSLYDFIEANHFPITKNGTFIAYKMVQKDFLDSHSRSFDNTPGNTVRMDRNKVNPNRNESCSTGLHVGAYSYASTFSGNVLLEVEVNPKDVVAVPYDYDSQKMRVCEYKVIRVCKSYREEIVYEDDVYDDDDFALPALEEEVESNAVVGEKVKIIRVPAALKAVVVNGRNQIVIPLQMLRKFGLEIGDPAYVSHAEGVLTISPVDNEDLQLFIGSTGLLITTEIIQDAGLYRKKNLELIATKGVLQVKERK